MEQLIQCTDTTYNVATNFGYIMIYIITNNYYIKLFNYCQKSLRLLYVDDLSGKLRKLIYTPAGNLKEELRFCISFVKY
ncbi:hypothetical protein PMIT1342_01873 [Prochlorococcus marinus str. MIT 1342]|nr:hypothetical protein PMIT1342_01873 [Prochlorococcus marinus str. MIT 1342]